MQELAEKDKDPWERTPPRLEPEKGGPIEQLWAIYDKTKVEPDPMKRHQLVWDMIKIHVDQGPFVHGLGGELPTHHSGQGRPDERADARRPDLGLGGFVNPWIHPTPAVYDPETWFFSNPDEHKG